VIAPVENVPSLVKVTVFEAKGVPLQVLFVNTLTTTEPLGLSPPEIVTVSFTLPGAVLTVALALVVSVGVAGVTVTDSVAAPQALFSVAALLFAVTLDVAAVTWKK
jgi:hypothetical protein